MSLTTFTKAPLSSSPFGRSIAVTGTTSPGALIHVPSLSQLDEIYLYAQNNGASSVTLNIFWGGTTVYDLTQTLLASQNGRTMLTDGKLLTGAGTIGAYLSAPGTVAIDGFVNRIVPGIDQRVVDWANRVVQRGAAAPSLNTQVALTTFIIGLDTDGLTSLMIMVNPFAPDSLTACMTPLIGVNWVSHLFVGVGTDLSVTGLQGDGATKYAETGLLPSHFNSIGTLSLVSYASIVPNNAFHGQLGSFDGSHDCFISTTLMSSGDARAVIGITVASPGAGFYTCQRTSTTVMKAYFANSFTPFAQLGATDVATASGWPTTTAYSMALQNSVGAAANFTPDTISFQAITQGLSAAQTQALYTRVQALRQAFGGGFV